MIQLTTLFKLIFTIPQKLRFSAESKLVLLEVVLPIMIGQRVTTLLLSGLMP